MYSVELKIKRVNLADEARTIRKEEVRAREAGNTGKAYSLQAHRTGVVRPAARNAHLAHTYLRGQPYLKAERTAKHPPYIWKNYAQAPEGVVEVIARFGWSVLGKMDKKELVKHVTAWIEDGAAPVGIRASNPTIAGSTPVSA